VELAHARLQREAVERDRLAEVRREILQSSGETTVREQPGRAAVVDTASPPCMRCEEMRREKPGDTLRVKVRSAGPLSAKECNDCLRHRWIAEPERQ